jgi:putative phosphoesterase
MRIAAFSDIHGNVAALEAVLADIEDQGVDATICLGDVVAFGPRPVEVLERLEAIGDLMLVRGNTERWLGLVRDRPEGPFEERVIASVAPSLSWTLERLSDDRVRSLLDLPTTGALEAGGLRVVAEHASPGSDSEGISLRVEASVFESMFDGFDGQAFLCGHTHEPFVRPVAGRVFVINDGSVGLPYDGIPKPSWALVELTGQGIRASIRRVPYDLRSVVDDIAQRAMVWSDVIARRVETAAKG